jgi:hypothetical protein
MKKIHSSLEQKFSWYQKYHLMPYHSALHMLFLIVFLLGVGAVSLEKFSVAHAATGDTIYILGGMGYNDVYSSTNATNWSLVSAQDTNPNLTTKWTTRGNDLDSNTPYFNGKMWVVQDYAVLVGGNWNSKIWSSPDGINWTVATTVAFPHQESSGTNHLFVFNNKLWLIREINGGNSPVLYTNPIYSSPDGITWTHIDTNAGLAGIQDGPWGYAGTSHMMSVSVFQNKIFVDGTFGATAGIWSSPDGIVWTNNTTAQNQDCVARNKHTSVVFNGKLWLLGGNTNTNIPQNDICSSSDGITWTTTVAHAPWTVVSPPNNYSIRGDFTSFVFNNKMYVGYGYLATQFNGNISGNTLWSSLDGITWTQEIMTGSAISNRQDLSTVVVPAQPACTLNTPSLVSPYTYSQYVMGGSNLSVTSLFKITTNTGCPADVITELKFKSNPNINTLSSVTVNGITAPFVGGVADVTGLNILIPSGTTGVTVPVKTSYNLISTLVPSGTQSRIGLFYVGGQVSNPYTTTGTGQNSFTYMVVGSRPSLTLNASTATLASTNTENELGSIYTTATTFGPIKVNTLPLTLSLIGTGVIPTTPNMLRVYNATTNVLIPTTDTGGVNPIITFTTPVQISTVTPITFKIKIVGLTMGTTANSTTISTKLNTNKALFSWLDVTGGATTPQTTNNSGYLLTYPTNTVSVHN